MGGTDRMDQNIAKFHVNVRIKKMVGLRSQSAECLATVQDFRSRVSNIDRRIACDRFSRELKKFETCRLLLIIFGLWAQVDSNRAVVITLPRLLSVHGDPIIAA